MANNKMWWLQERYHSDILYTFLWITDFVDIVILYQWGHTVWGLHTLTLCPLHKIYCFRLISLHGLSIRVQLISAVRCPFNNCRQWNTLKYIRFSETKQNRKKPSESQCSLTSLWLLYTCFNVEWQLKTGSADIIYRHVPVPSTRPARSFHVPNPNHI